MALDADTKKYVDDSISEVQSFSTKKIGDTPTDSDQLTPKSYVDTQIAQISSVISTNTGPGGNGNDGTLSFSNGTTTINCNGSPVLIKNYKSVSIGGTGKLAFTNAPAGGTTVVFLSQGDISVTSSATPAVDLRGIGGLGANAGSIASAGTSATNYAGIVDGLTHAGQGGAVGVGGASTLGFAVQYRGRITGPGQGGGGGAGGTNGAFSFGASGGAGGAGGGSLILESGASITITGLINLSGGDGSVGVGTGDGVHGSALQGGAGGGGGGGGAGSFIANYVDTYTNIGTIILSGGAGGTGGAINSGGTGGAGSPGTGGGGGSGGATVTNGGQAGGNPSGGPANIGGNGGNGAAGIVLVNQLA